MALSDKLSNLKLELDEREKWIKDQFETANTRKTKCEQCLKSAGRLKNLLNVKNANFSENQLILINTMRQSFKKDIVKLQEDLIQNNNNNTNMQSLIQSQKQIKELMNQNQNINFELMNKKKEINNYVNEIEKLRNDNEKLLKLKDLLIKQNENMTSKISQNNGKDEALTKLQNEIQTLKDNHKNEILKLQQENTMQLHEQVQLQTNIKDEKIQELMEQLTRNKNACMFIYIYI